MPPDELSVIERFLRPLAGEGAFDFRDDAAQLKAPAGCDLVITADMIAAGVHFLPDDPPDTIARKALRVNLSDLAAKGATPLGYLLSLGLATAVEDPWLAEFAAGLRDDQERFGIRLLGGDTVVLPGGPTISVTAIGTVPLGRMVHRSGGRPGDVLYVSGLIGASAAGLKLLQGKPGPWDCLGAGERAALVRRYRVPEPRVVLAPALVQYASAAMDVSDGLVGDCDKLAGASGCAAMIAAEDVPLPGGAVLADDEAAVAMLITGGDDYEILAAVPPEREVGFRRAAAEANTPVARIGRLLTGQGPTEVRFRGRTLELNQRSFVHGPREGGS